MSLLTMASGLNIDPYLGEEIRRSSRIARVNGALLVGSVIALSGVIFIMINNYGASYVGFEQVPLPFGIDRLLGDVGLNSLLMGAVGLATASGRFAAQIASARRDRMTLMLARFLLMEGDREQATQILLMYTMGAGDARKGNLLDLLGS